MGTPISIAELKELTSGGGEHGAEVHGQLDKATSKTTKGGKPYFDWLVRDAEESLTLKVWENHRSFAKAGEVGPGAFLAFGGKWSAGDYGLESPDWDFRPLEEGEVEALLSAGGRFAKQQVEDYAYIEAQVAGLEDLRLRAVCSRFLDAYGKRLKRTAAARDYHHARRGGLVEHVAQMMRAANALCDVYPKVHRGLVLAGALFHDCGKLWENCFPERGFTMGHTEVGELLGHIPVGLEVVNKLWHEAEGAGGEEWGEAEPPSGEVKLHLLHLIASHHGEYAFGSPTLPRTPEAQLLHYIDNIDAKMEMFRRGYEGQKLLAPHIYERVRPLPANLVEPLGGYVKGDEG